MGLQIMLHMNAPLDQSVTVLLQCVQLEASGSGSITSTFPEIVALSFRCATTFRIGLMPKD
jgi:hypothetical protein